MLNYLCLSSNDNRVVICSRVRSALFLEGQLTNSYGSPPHSKNMPDIFPNIFLWFGNWVMCKEWKAMGHMHEPGVCQGRAQDLLGVVY
jgi:hypothetical protein